MKIFLDESGYTGEDLLNKDQPIFVLASNNFNEQEIEAIWQENFSGRNPTELKHSILARNKSGQGVIISLIKFLNAAFPSRTIAIGAHKEYVATSMVIEWLIEPAMKRRGFNLYEQGGNIGLSNILFLGLHNICPQSIKREFLIKSQNLLRQKTRKNYELFWRFANDIHENIPESRVFLDFLMPAQCTFDESGIANLPHGSIDISLNIAFNSIAWWRMQTQSPLEVIHDVSKPMAKAQRLWEQILSSDVEEKVFQFSGEMELRFPLNLKSTSFANSKDFLQLQLSDIIAGSTATWLRSKWNDETTPYIEQLAEAGIQNLLQWRIWPSTEVTPQELGTENIDFNKPLEFISSQIRDLPSE